MEVYSAGKPSTVTVYTTPSLTSVHVNYDLGYFVQDSWTIKRLTLNPGLRVETYLAMRKQELLSFYQLDAGSFHVSL